MADNLDTAPARGLQTPAPHPGATIIPFPSRPPRPLAPPFDPRNPAHVAAWEALFAFGLAQTGGR